VAENPSLEPGTRCARVTVASGSAPLILRPIGSPKGRGISMKIDPTAETFGLPNSLLIPIAAADIASIAEFAGRIVAEVRGRSGRVNAVKVRTRFHPKDPDRVPLWDREDSKETKEKLFPEFQVWVHVDFGAYRKAYRRLAMPALDEGVVLDHISNRKATRARGYLHPYFRLCPVSKLVNTNAGHRLGGEGMERQYTDYVLGLPESERSELLSKMKSSVVYADPMDLTKMLDISPGTYIIFGAGFTGCAQQ